jgi:hydrogenase expression/formation protein HypD
MKYIDEFRNPEAVRKLVDQIHEVTTRPWNLMEVCGGQTHSIIRFGLDRLLPDSIRLIHGPGCPVCVTPIEAIDRAISIASRPGVILCSFGDMLRVPGSDKDLLTVKSEGADVRIVYSPIDAVTLAQENPDREVVFFAIGFETTAPADAMAIAHAARLDLKNFSALVSHVLVPPAMRAVLDSPLCQVNGFLAAGHVCAVMGVDQYRPIAEEYKIPIIVTGFEPVDILQGILFCVKQLESGRHEVENQYARWVRDAGNPVAQKQINELFEVVTQKWRGIGSIPESGYALRKKYAGLDAAIRFDVTDLSADEPSECRAGEVLQGHIRPHECPAFGKTCTPENPLGAPMVSSEGACAAYWKYRMF